MVAVPPLTPTPPADRARGVRRDPSARAALATVARAVVPTVLACDRVLAVPGPLGDLLPGGGLRRGSVATVAGAPGAGATSLALALAAAATSVGEWAVVVDPDRTLGGLALAEAGVDPARGAVVRGVARDRWAPVVAALLDGVAVVVAPVPVGLRAGDARRLVARVRERGAVLVALETGSRAVWPADAPVRLEAGRGGWTWGDAPGAPLRARDLEVRVAGRGLGRGREATVGDAGRGGLAAAS